MGPDRAVQVISGDSKIPGVKIRGSGFLFAPGIVVTAGHNLRDGDPTVRLGRSSDQAAQIACDTRPYGLDFAVLRVNDLAHVPGTAPIARVNRHTSLALEPCWAVGYPRFMIRHGDGCSLQDSVHVRGTMAPGTGIRSGYLQLRVTDTPSEIPDESPWEGVSGAVVFATDREWGEIAIGVVIEHGLGEGPGALTVLPFTALDDLPEPQRANAWALLGSSNAALPLLPRIHDEPEPTGPDNARALLDIVLWRRAFYDGDNRMVESLAIYDDPNSTITYSLSALSTQRALDVATSLSRGAEHLREALAAFADPAPGPVRTTVRKLGRLCKDYAEDFGRDARLPSIGQDKTLSDLSLGPTPLGMPADDSFAAFCALATYLASSCSRLIEVREAALRLVEAITEGFPHLRSDGGEAMQDIRNGIAQLHDLDTALRRASDIVAHVIAQDTDIDTRRAAIGDLARHEGGTVAELLGGISVVASMRTWTVPKPPRT